MDLSWAVRHPGRGIDLYQIAAFYNKDQGGSLDLEDGLWFSIPPTREGERSLTGTEKRARVKVEAMKDYEDSRKEKAEAALLQELLETCEDQATPRQGVDPSDARSLNSAEPQLPLLVSEAENSGMAIAMLDDQGLECASQSSVESMSSNISIVFSSSCKSSIKEFQAGDGAEHASTKSPLQAS